MVAEEYVLEGHQRLVDQLAEHFGLTDLAQILAVRLALRQTNDLVPIELHELMAEKIDHGAGIIARLIKVAGLIQEREFTATGKGKASIRSASPISGKVTGVTTAAFRSRAALKIMNIKPASMIVKTTIAPQKIK
jgi:hypothetical protein